MFSNSFIPAAVRQWNMLSPSVRNSEDLETYQRKLDKDKPKVNDLYYVGKRKANILHSKIRISCSQLNQDMHKIGILNSPACACGASVESSFHFFFECCRYTTERNTLHMLIIPKAPFTLNTLLHGNSECTKAENISIFEATQTFIVNTGRFNYS